MLSLTNGISKARYIDSRIKLYVHHILLELNFDSVVHLRLWDSTIVENRKAWNKNIALSGDNLNTSACKLQLADVGIDRHKFLGRDSLKVALCTCRYLQDKFAVDILVIGALNIRYLCDDSLCLIHCGITKGKTIFSYY